MSKKLVETKFRGSIKDGVLSFDSDPYVRSVLKDYADTKVRVIVEKIGAKRTGRQNRALHKYFDLLATELNDAGYNVQIVLQEKLAVNWTADMVKEVLWRPAQKVLLKKKSTAELDKAEDITNVYEHLNRHLGEKFGIHVPFPSYESEEERVQDTI